MKILFAASEALPLIASGGLADVAGSLPKAIRNRQHACRVVIPLYGDIAQEYKDKMKFLCSFTVPLSWRNQHCGVYEINVRGVIYYLIDNEYYFKRVGIYGFYDDAERFAFFSKAVLEMLVHIDYQPDIINCNDWQTAMIPIYLNAYYRNIVKFLPVKTVFTIHNIQYQGKYGMELCADVLGLPDYMKPIVEYEKCLNMMKGAICESDIVSTVSPSYAQEIMDPWFSHGLDPLLRGYQYKLRGILNGIDNTVYDPKTDPALFENFNVATVEKKAINKQKLQEMVGLEQRENVMLIGIVTRFVSHKGLDLIKYVFHDLMRRDVQIVALGSGEYVYECLFEDMQSRYPGRVAFVKGFIPDLARKIYAGADVFLMPSKSEPCGLAQMVSLRYGTIPIVRATGGLKDSITDLGEEGGVGYTFKTYNAHDMLGAIDRALGLYGDPESWMQAVMGAMQADFGWGRSADEYIAMYKSLVGEG